MESVAWRCSACQQLIYNRDENGHPAYGASDSRFYSTEHPRVCSLCYEMRLVTVGSSYWDKIQNEERDEERRRKEQKTKILGDNKPW